MIRRRSAISLLEVTIVMLVLGVMAAVTAPRFGTAVRGGQCYAAAIQVASHINYVRRVAKNEGRETSLQFTPVSAQYLSTNVDSPERVGTRLFVDLRETYGLGLGLNCDLDNTTSLTFDLEGVPHVGTQWLQNGTVTVSIGDISYDVTIASGTGIASVQSNTVPLGSVVGVPSGASVAGSNP